MYDDYDEQNSYGQDYLPYQIISKEDVIRLLVEKVNNVSGLLDINFENAFSLMQFLSWDDRKLEEVYLGSNHAKLKQEMVDQGVLGIGTIKEVPLQFCPVCCRNEQMMGLMLQCGHVFCVECWHQQMQDSLASFIPIVGCLADQCRQRVPFGYLKEHFKSSEMAISKRFVEFSKEICWCPGCENMFQTHSVGQLSVECVCGCKFCFNCKNQTHTPLPCDIAKLWMFLLQDVETQSNHWISLNTKKCPHCNRHIQRNQGCNHIKCICDKHFCYVCEQEWGKEHTNFYSCPQDKVVKTKYQSIVDRYEGVYKQFCSEEQLINGYLKLLNELKYDDNSYQFIEYLKESVPQIIEFGVFLKWAYCLCYFMQDQTQTFQLLKNQLEQFKGAYMQLLDILTNNVIGSDLSELSMDGQETIRVLVQQLLVRCRIEQQSINQQVCDGSIYVHNMSQQQQ